MGKRKYVYMILAGLLVIAVNIKIDTGISYGFVIGEGEGVSLYAATQIVTSYVGANLHIDLLFDPIGYLLIMAGFLLLGKSRQRDRAVLLAAVGLVCKLIEMFLPMLSEPKSLILPLIALFLLQMLSTVAIMYALKGLCTAKIDNYKYMQVGKDLTFGAELYGICLVIGQILYLFTKAEWYFSKALYVIVSVAGVCAMCYYAVKLWEYMRMLAMFTEEAEVKNE